MSSSNQYYPNEKKLMVNRRYTLTWLHCTVECRLLERIGAMDHATMLSLPVYMTAYMPRSNKNEGDIDLIQAYCKTLLWMTDLFGWPNIVNNKRFVSEIQGRGHGNEIAQVIQTHALGNNLRGTYCLQAPFPRSTWTTTAENLRKSAKNLLQKVDPLHFVLQICSDRISKFQ